MQIALYQPDIPQNTGNMLRTAACLNVPTNLNEPAGFDITDRAFRRAGLDYLDHAAIKRHTSFEAFEQWLRENSGRLIALTSSANQRYIDFEFEAGDVLLLGRESAGLPDAVHARADARLKIPMRQGLRSINVAAACAMVIGEALRQTHLFPN